MVLFTQSAGNSKTAKNPDGWDSLILHLSPYKLSGKQFCADASTGCAAACLNTAGRGRFDSTQAARFNRSRLFIDDRKRFMDCIRKEIASFLRRCERNGTRPAIRLNGTSDLPWEKIDPSLFSDFSDVQFYDYSKSLKRAVGALPDNYHLTFSRSENNWQTCLQVLRSGVNVAAVVAPSLMERKKIAGWRCHHGDQHDLRFLDPSPRLVLLAAKGDAKHDKSGFVIR